MKGRRPGLLQLRDPGAAPIRRTPTNRTSDTASAANPRLYCLRQQRHGSPLYLAQKPKRPSRRPAPILPKRSVARSGGLPPLAMFHPAAAWRPALGRVKAHTATAAARPILPNSQQADPAAHHPLHSAWLTGPRGHHAHGSSRSAWLRLPLRYTHSPQPSHPQPLPVAQAGPSLARATAADLRGAMTWCARCWRARLWLAASAGDAAHERQRCLSSAG